MEDLQNKVEALEAKMDAIATQLTAGFELISDRFDRVDKKISDIKGNATQDLGAVEVAVKDGFDKVIKELTRINHEINYKGKTGHIPGVA